MEHDCGPYTAKIFRDCSLLTERLIHTSEVIKLSHANLTAGRKQFTFSHDTYGFFFFFHFLLFYERFF